jgi:DNA-binding transcriptional regulator YiaG
MNKEVVICPACGSQQVGRSENESVGQLTLGPKFSFKEINYKCASCGEDGDFLAETDKNYLASQKEAQSSLVRQILENMNNAGISMAMFERVFELPARTLTRWKNGDFSSSSLALLRIVTTYPWIIEVAENKFEKIYSKSAVIKAAAEEFNVKINSNIQSQISETSSGSSAVIVVKVNSPAKSVIGSGA